MSTLERAIAIAAAAHAGQVDKAGQPYILGESRLQAAARAAANPIARVVKLADNAENMDLGRIANPTEKDFARLKEYEQVRIDERLQTAQRACDFALVPEYRRHLCSDAWNSGWRWQARPRDLDRLVPCAGRPDPAFILFGAIQRLLRGSQLPMSVRT